MVTIHGENKMITFYILKNLILGALFSFGAILLLRTSPLNKIKMKPISCNICMSFWFYCFYMILSVSMDMCDNFIINYLLETIIYGFCVVGIVKILMNISNKPQDEIPNILIGEDTNDK